MDRINKMDMMKRSWFWDWFALVWQDLHLGSFQSEQLKTEAGLGKLKMHCRGPLYMIDQNIKLEIKLKLLTFFVSLNKVEWGGSIRCSWFIFCLVPLSSFSSSVHVVFGCVCGGGCMCQSQFICSWQHIFSRRQLSPHQLRSWVYSAFSVEVTLRICCHEIEPKGKKMSGQIFSSNISEHWSWQCLICSFKSQAFLSVWRWVPVNIPVLLNFA